MKESTSQWVGIHREEQAHSETIELVLSCVMCYVKLTAGRLEQQRRTMHSSIVVVFFVHVVL